MTDKELFENCDGICEELLKNAAHSCGIDFERLNLTLIELSKRIRKEKEKINGKS